MNFCSCAPLQHKENCNSRDGSQGFYGNLLLVGLPSSSGKEQNLPDQKSLSRGMVFKNSEQDFRKSNNLR